MSKITRRQFIHVSALGAGAAMWGGAEFLSAKETAKKLNVAVIGVGDRARILIREAIGCGANISVICDADDEMIKSATKFIRKNQGGVPKAYKDYRRLLEVEAGVEAVIIASPDHWHALHAEAALKAGKHVYCEKPLTRTISEARKLRELARGSKMVTQMGNQGSANNGMRRAIELVQAGALGKVREVHVWAPESGSFKAGQPAPVGEDPVPAALRWDDWLGPAPVRPYKSGIYHPKAWRAWYDFGGGSMADWGCHGLNLPFRALKLGYPTTIVADVQGEPCISYPARVRVRYDFAAREGLPPVTVWWYDGGRRPSVDVVPPSLLQHFGEMPKLGVLLLGERGFTFGAPHPGAEYVQLAGEGKLSGILNHQATRDVAQTLPRTENHMREWLNACQTGAKTFSDFETGGMLTEIALAGVVAIRAGKKLEWDGPAMRATNVPEAEEFIHACNRKGWG